MQTTAAYLQTTIMTVSKKVAHKSGAQTAKVISAQNVVIYMVVIFTQD